MKIAYYRVRTPYFKSRKMFTVGEDMIKELSHNQQKEKVFFADVGEKVIGWLTVGDCRQLYGSRKRKRDKYISFPEARLRRTEVLKVQEAPDQCLA